VRNALRVSRQRHRASERYTIAQRMNPQHEHSLFNHISLFTEVLHEPTRAIPLCQEFIRRFPTSDKLPVVQQQLARSRNAGDSNPLPDTQNRAKLSEWLKEQQERKP